MNKQGLIYKFYLKDNLFFLLILFISLFSSSYVFFKYPFEFYFYYILIIILLPIFIIKNGIPKFVLYIFSCLLLVGTVHILLGNNLSFTFIKIYGGLFVMILFYFHIINIVNFNIEYLFYWYCRFSLLLSIIGLIQLVSFLLNFKFGYDFTWILNKWGVVNGGLIGIRINSIISEPTYLATVLSPALYVAIKNIISKTDYIFNKYQSFLIILIVILTTSTIGYFGVLISILLCTKTIRLRYIIFGVLITIAGFNLAYNYVSDFKQRIDSAKGLWLDQNFHISNTNNSSFVLYNNLHVAKENLSSYPLFGTGLGSHETAFKKHTLTKTLIQYDFEFNVKDGNSLFVRLCTETGLVGLSLVLLLLIKGFIYESKYDNEELSINVVISQSLFILFILVLIRQGNYMLNGLPMMFLLYYYNFKDYHKKIEKIEKK